MLTLLIMAFQPAQTMNVFWNFHSFEFPVLRISSDTRWNAVIILVTSSNILDVIMQFISEFMKCLEFLEYSTLDSTLIQENLLKLAEKF